MTREERIFNMKGINLNYMHKGGGVSNVVVGADQ